MKLIDGVKTKQLRVIPDDRGWVMEILRCDDPDLFTQFGQAYVTACYPGIVKAWHAHRHRTELFSCIYGMAKLGAYDDREDSPTAGQINEFIIGNKNPMIVSIPPGVMHGYTTVGGELAMLVNIPTELYDYEHPDEIRRPWNDPEIGYNWGVANR